MKEVKIATEIPGNTQRKGYESRDTCYMIYGARGEKMKSTPGTGREEDQLELSVSQVSRAKRRGSAEEY